MNNVADLSPPAYTSTVHTFLIAVNLRLYLLCHARVRVSIIWHAMLESTRVASHCSVHLNAVYGTRCLSIMSYLRVVLVVVVVFWLLRIRLALDITRRRLVRRRCRILRVRSVCRRLDARPPSLSLCLTRLLSL